MAVCLPVLFFIWIDHEQASSLETTAPQEAEAHSDGGSKVLFGSTEVAAEPVRQKKWSNANVQQDASFAPWLDWHSTLPPPISACKTTTPDSARAYRTQYFDVTSKTSKYTAHKLT